MPVKPYAMVRGSVIRVTALDPCGDVAEPVQYAVAKCVAKVTIREVMEASKSEVVENEEEDRRLHFTKPGQLIQYTAAVDFLLVDPTVLELVAGVAPLLNRDGDVAGFESLTNQPAVAFALEIWSKLAGQQCADGQQAWGYTLIPFLYGGYLSGFEFGNALVTFNLTDAQTRRNSRWGVGPHDLEGPFERLIDPVSRNTAFRTFVTSGAPPVPFDGIRTLSDVLDNGTAANPMPDPDAPLFVDAGSATTAGPFIIDGGQAA